MKKKTVKALSTVLIIILLGVCAFLTYKLYDANRKIEKISSQQVSSKGTEVKKDTNNDTKENTTNSQDGNVLVYEDSQRGVKIALIDYGKENQHVIITLETKYSVEYMYGTYYINEKSQTYLHFQQDIGELRLNGIDGIEIEPNTNGGTNVKVTVSQDSITIGNGTLKRI